ncbi:hypothetical protein [Nevskia sp.]|uniref:hypothetical protein n=1 Tax=Nevskia sp. TaxID=1929292 RepID=UPI0025D4D1D2|nr:hypothetical protein [Nevskia sp.]
MALKALDADFRRHDGEWEGAALLAVIPAKAGIQYAEPVEMALKALDADFRRHDRD